MFQTRAGFFHFCPERLVVAIATCALLLPFMSPSGSRAVAVQVAAVEVKAAFIINFLQFVEWPPERVPPEDKPYVVAVLNSPSLQRAVETAATGQAIEGRTIAVQAVSSADDASEAL